MSDPDLAVLHGRSTDPEWRRFVRSVAVVSLLWWLVTLVWVVETLRVGIQGTWGFALVVIVVWIGLSFVWLENKARHLRGDDLLEGGVAVG